MTASLDRKADQEYRNPRGQVMKIYSPERWGYFLNETANPQYLYWSALPQEAHPFWQAVAMSMFWRGSGGTAKVVADAARRFYQWLGDREIASFDDLSQLDWAALDEWLKRQPGKKGLMTMRSRMATFTGLKAAFVEGVTLGRGELTAATVAAISDGTRNRFRHVDDHTAQARAKRVLTPAQVDHLYEAFFAEYRTARQLLDESDRPARLGAQQYGQQIEVDVVTMVAMWLSITYGVRAEELPAMRVSDFVEDTTGRGAHRLYCHAPNKNPKPVPVDEVGHRLIQMLIAWTEGPRAALGTDHLFVYWMGVRRDQPQVVNGISLYNRRKSFLQRYNLGNLNLSPKNLRSTFGERIATHTENRLVVQELMRHESPRTSERFYQTKNEVEHAAVVARALAAEAMRHAMLYGYPVLDLESERPEVKRLLEENPDRDLGYGVCGVPLGCKRAEHCFLCPHLIVEVSRRPYYVREKERNEQLALQCEDRRKGQQYQTIAERAGVLIRLIDQRLAEERIESAGKQRTRKRQHKPVDF